MFRLAKALRSATYPGEEPAVPGSSAGSGGRQNTQHPIRQKYFGRATNGPKKTCGVQRKGRWAGVMHCTAVRHHPSIWRAKRNQIVNPHSQVPDMYEQESESSMLVIQPDTPAFLSDGSRRTKSSHQQETRVICRAQHPPGLHSLASSCRPQR